VRKIYSSLAGVAALAVAAPLHATEVAVLNWAKFEDPSSGYSDSATDMAIGSNGAVYVTGMTHYEGYGTVQYTTIRYTGTGTRSWIQTYDATPCGSPLRLDAVFPPPAIAIDETNSAVYVCGRRCSSSGNLMLLLRYNMSSGSLEWAHEFSLGEDLTAYGDDVAVNSDGDVIVTGQLEYDTDDFRVGTVKFTVTSTTCTEAWYATYDPPGSYGPNTNAGRSLAIASNDDVIVAAQAIGSSGTDDYTIIRYADSDGDEIWALQYNREVSKTDAEDAPVEIVLDSSNNAYVTGSSVADLYEFNSVDILTIEVSSAGALQWAEDVTGSGYGLGGAGIARDGDGNFLVVGTDANSDYVTIKYEPDGDTIWSRTYDGPGSLDIGCDVAVDSSKNVYVTGISDRVDGAGTDTDIATLKYDSSGNLIWTARYNVVIPGSSPTAYNSEHACNIGWASTNNRVDITGGRTDLPNDPDSFLTIQYKQLAID
jgi:hypothetical protein